MTANVLNYVDQTDASQDNKVHLEGTIFLQDAELDAEAVKNVALSNDISVYDSGVSDILNTGYALLDGGTGFTVDIESPEAGALTHIKLRSITSGSVVISTPSGVTWDGSNTDATFADVDDELIVGYKSDTEFEIYTNNGVVLS